MIQIKGLELSAQIGVPEAERGVAQRLTVNLELEPLRDFRQLEDEIGNTVDYYEVSRAVQALCRERPRKLIETLADEIARMLLAKYPLRAVELELRKYILPDTQYVAVRLRRGR